MRILVSSCLPLDFGGYPNQLNYLLGRLHARGDKLGAICWNFTYPWHPKPTPLRDILAIEEFGRIAKDLDMRVYQDLALYTTHTPLGNYENFWGKLEGFVADFRPDILLVYQDILVFPNYNIGKLPCQKYLWLPVHDNFRDNPLVPSHIADPEARYTDSTLRFLPLFDKVACFSQFGRDVLGSYGYEATLIPHAVPAKLWKPIGDPQLRTKYRKILGLPGESFVCLMVASNTELSNRKAFDYNMRGFAKFTETHDNARLLLRTNMEGVANLWDVARALGIAKKIVNLPEKMPQREVAIVYGVSDALLSASKSEGFGIPIVEAQMCGVPVVTTECTAMPEVTHLGICTKPSEVSLRVGGHNSWSHPDSDEICKALHRIRKGEYERKRVPTERYDPDRVWELWKAFLGE